MSDSTRILFIDPSSGSKQSLPGYLELRAGKVVGAGVLDIPHSIALNRRLHRLVTALRTDFEKVDLLVTEVIPPFFINQGYTRAVTHLQRAVGATLGGVDCEAHIEVPAQTWHKFEPAGYMKSDTKDAIMLAVACYRTVAQLRGQPEESELLASLYALLNDTHIQGRA